jgi:hypothetical protein
MIEWIFRIVTKDDTSKFMGPTLASAGLGFLVPLLVEESREVEIGAELQKELKEKGLKAVVKRDDDLFGLVAFAIFVGIAAWIGTLYLASRATPAAFLSVNDYLWAGLGTYFVGVIIAYIREKN